MPAGLGQVSPGDLTDRAPGQRGREMAPSAPPFLAEATPGYTFGVCPRHLLPAPLLLAPDPVRQAKAEPHAGASPATPHVPSTNPSTYSALPWTGVATPSLGCHRPLVTWKSRKTGRPMPCPSRLPRIQWGPRAPNKDSIYLRSLRVAGAGGHRRSGLSGHSASCRVPREWGPPARETPWGQVSQE